MKMTGDQAVEVGRRIANLLGVKPTQAGRFRTEEGLKSIMGIGQSVIRILEEVSKEAPVMPWPETVYCATGFTAEEVSFYRRVSGPHPGNSVQYVLVPTVEREGKLFPGPSTDSDNPEIVAPAKIEFDWHGVTCSGFYFCGWRYFAVDEGVGVEME